MTIEFTPGFASFRLDEPLPAPEPSGLPTVSAPVARRLDDEHDPHIAPVTPQTPPVREHAGTGTLIHDHEMGGVLTHGYNCHSLAFHAGSGHPGRTPARDGLANSPNWDASPTRDMKASHRLLDTEPVKVGDVLMYGDDHNGNGRIDRDDEAVHSVVVTEVDAQGRAVRVAGKLGADVVSDHHPSHLDPQLRALNGNLHEWYRPRETGRQHAQRMNFVQSQLQADLPPAQRSPIDWFRDPRLAPVTPTTPPPKAVEGLVPTEHSQSHNPHLFAWNPLGAKPAPSAPDDLYGPGPIEGLARKAHQLREGEPAKVGDVLAYGKDSNRNDRLEPREIERSAIVIAVDHEGAITRVRSQDGPHDPVVDHHPRQPAENGRFDEPLTRTAVYRPRETPEQTFNRLDYALGR